MEIDDEQLNEPDANESTSAFTRLLSPMLRSAQRKPEPIQAISNAEWLVKDLRFNDTNPRKNLRDAGFDDLVASIKAQGILTPLLITREGVVLAGNRRLAAAHALKLQSVPVRVLATDKTIDRAVVPLIENLVRTDLTPIDAMNYMSSLRKRFSMTATGISHLTGISVGTVAQYLRIADGPKAIKQMLAEDRIGLTTASALLRHADSELVSLLSEREQVSYKEAQQLIAQLQAQKEGRKERITEALPARQPDSVTASGFLFYSGMVLRFIESDLCDVGHEQIHGRLKELYDAIFPALEKAKRPRKSPKVGANRNEHPAVVAFKAATGFFPKRMLLDQVIQTLGDSPDTIRLHEAFVAWIGRGYNPQNLSWLDWYINGMPEGSNGKNKSKRNYESASQRNVRNITDSLAYLTGVSGNGGEADPEVKTRLITSGS